MLSKDLEQRADALLQKQAQMGLASRAAGRGLGGLVTQAATLAGVALGADALFNLGRRAMSALGESKRYRSMLEANPDLLQQDARKVQERFRMVERYGGPIAQDPTLAGHWIRQTMEFPVITPTVLRDLVDVGTRAGDPLGMRQNLGKGIISQVSRGMGDDFSLFGGQ